MGALLERVASLSALSDSWKRVLANDAEDDVLSAGVRRFAQDAGRRIDELRTHLLSGDYRPARLTRVSIPKEDGDERVLHIPPVADRIVERAVLSVLTLLIDPLLGPGSFAYRPASGFPRARRCRQFWRTWSWNISTTGSGGPVIRSSATPTM